MARKRATKTRLPKKSSLMRTADTLWSVAVRMSWDHKCAVCGYWRCEAHHLIPRDNYATRYLLENGIALCFRHHKVDNDIGAHQNAAGWMEWLEENHPIVAAWYKEHKRDKFHGTKTQMYYVERIAELRTYFEPHEFKDIVGPTLLGHLDRLKDDA